LSRQITIKALSRSVKESDPTWKWPDYIIAVCYLSMKVAENQISSIFADYSTGSVRYLEVVIDHVVFLYYQYQILV